MISIKVLSFDYGCSQGPADLCPKPNITVFESLSSYCNFLIWVKIYVTGGVRVNQSNSLDY